jgi:hypothetical protein
VNLTNMLAAFFVAWGIWLIVLPFLEPWINGLP